MPSNRRSVQAASVTVLEGRRGPAPSVIKLAKELEKFASAREREAAIAREAAACLRGAGPSSRPRN